MMDFHGTKCKVFIIYAVMGPRVAVLRFLCISIFFMAKTDFFPIIFSILFLIFRAFSMGKNSHMKTLELQLLGP